MALRIGLPAACLYAAVQLGLGRSVGDAIASGVIFAVLFGGSRLEALGGRAEPHSGAEGCGCWRGTARARGE